MIEKIKYHLRNFLFSKQIRVRAIAFFTALTVAIVTLLNCSIYTVEIFDGEKTYTVRTLNSNAAQVLANFDLKSDSYKIVTTTVENRLTSFEIEYTFPVFITKGDQTFEISFSGGTVEKALAELDIIPDEYDFVEPSLKTEITETAYIDYTDIDYVKGSYTEKIPYTTKTTYSSSMEEGEVTITKGSDGIKRVDYTQKYVNGKLAEKNVTDTAVITAAVDAVKTIGTKPFTVLTSANVSCISTLKPSAPIELDTEGNPVNYKQKMTVRATAYTYTGNNCSTGVKPQPGYIAVNPKVIPYGTKMYIKTTDGKYIYGYAVAADTGGFVKNYPTGVDLFLPTESDCQRFGVRYAEIYILK